MSPFSLFSGGPNEGFMPARMGKKQPSVRNLRPRATHRLLDSQFTHLKDGNDVCPITYSLLEVQMK